jgi:hypothetical protein
MLKEYFLEPFLLLLVGESGIGIFVEMSIGRWNGNW